MKRPKRFKPPNPDALRKATDKAVHALRKSSIAARRAGWLSPEQARKLSEAIVVIEQMFVEALPAPVEEGNTSEAELPF